MTMTPRALRSKQSILLGVTLAAMLAAAGCQAPSTEELRTSGIDYYRNGQLIESMAAMRHVIERKPEDPQGHYYMGLNYRTLAQRKFRDGDVPAARRLLDLAIFHFDQTVRSWPNYVYATASKNEALEARGKFEKGLEVAQYSTTINRGAASEHFTLMGNEYRERGDYDGAVKAYRSALASDPESSRAYAEMGRLYLMVGDDALAQDSLTKAYELNPSEPGVVEALAQVERSPEARPASLDSRR
jgi:tetratricopeptide (TPR) repeat protein